MYTMTRTKRVLLALCTIFLMGALAGCEILEIFFAGRPTISCFDTHVTVAPGTCTVITNPCLGTGRQWVFDAFRLISPPEGIKVEADSAFAATTRTRKICAEPSVAIATYPVDYVYTRELSKDEAQAVCPVKDSSCDGFGFGTINITVEPPQPPPTTTTTLPPTTTTTLPPPTTTTLPPTEADLAVTISDSADPVPSAGPLTYTFVVVNNGPQTATGVSLTYPLPLGTEINEPVVPSQGTCTLSLTNILTCDFGTLASGNSATLQLPIFSLSVGLMSSTATVTANESDPDPSNDTDTETTTVN